MSTSVWLNLPIHNIQTSAAFYTQLGFDTTDMTDKIKFVVGRERLIVMLFPEPVFRSFTGGAAIADTSSSAEVLISLGMESKAAVDALIAKAESAGATILGKPHDQGWMYGAAFADPDGHRWNLLYMAEQ
ncbi:VOC family protein [Paenibacillus ferrarius]|uniref:VOC family protein n=1 Tax=Paenibacillus ferrarius TaxID=1469647 RepID=UPI003D271ECF